MRLSLQLRILHFLKQINRPGQLFLQLLGVLVALVEETGLSLHELCQTSHVVGLENQEHIGVTVIITEKAAHNKMAVVCLLLFNKRATSIDLTPCVTLHA